MQRTSILLALALVPGAALAQFIQNPGMSPTQERLLNPIPFPPPAPAPSPPVPMIVPPAAIVSTPPPLTVFPSGSGPVVNPVDRREQTTPPASKAARTPVPAQKPDGSKEINWQTVTLPPPPNFTSRGQAAGRTDSEGAAKSFIEADGYRQVTGLARGADGVWRGKALRGNTEVTVTVNARGDVMAN